jgi:hypothetical protein
LAAGELPRIMDLLKRSLYAVRNREDDIEKIAGLNELFWAGMPPD